MEKSIKKIKKTKKNSWKYEGRRLERAEGNCTYKKDCAQISANRGEIFPQHTYSRGR